MKNLERIFAMQFEIRRIKFAQDFFNDKSYMNKKLHSLKRRLSNKSIIDVLLDLDAVWK